MCGIVGVISRVGQLAPPPDVADLVGRLVEIAACVERPEPDSATWRLALGVAQRDCRAIVDDLAGLSGLVALRDAGEALGRFRSAVGRLGLALDGLEETLDGGAHALDARAVESLNGLVVGLRDDRFALSADRLANLEPVLALAGGSSRPETLRIGYDINIALRALGRLEVRGRDSAGLHLMVRGEFAPLTGGLAAELEERERVADFAHRAVRRASATGDPTQTYSFIYKVAAEIGELGDNPRALREAIVADELLAHLLETTGVTADVLGHTRWASVGLTSEPNAHPLNQEEAVDPGQEGSATGPYTVAALNGDVDNYKDIVVANGLQIAPGITTDAKVIPAVVSRGVAAGLTPQESFRRAVAGFEGSVAIACGLAREPGRLYLAQRGSGQALYVGVARDSYVIASEPYGVVEETQEYLRLEGEGGGQIVCVDGDAGLSRWSYAGDELPVTERDLKTTEVKTRDLDRGDHRHFLAKEIHEAPRSFRKTLRGRIAQGTGGRLRVVLGEETLPAGLCRALASGACKRFRVIGQGTAAVAGQGVASALRSALPALGADVEALPASELSGFHLEDDLSDMLVVAISQSGTTTDTNRTVDLVRARGARVLAIVNRRGSDLTDKADGVLYTSDGRDVELSVASTKAFYSQIAAGVLLAEGIAQAAGVGDPDRRHRLLEELQSMPGRLTAVLAGEGAIAAAAHAHAPPRRNWALVGNGRNKIAANEIRIKLSELCYKSIACDFTEDKKHIDLSTEPLVLVCATGLEEATAADVAKELDIFRAHKALPVVITDRPELHAGDQSATCLAVPVVGEELAYVQATMVGHLFGYHAAQAIDALARPLREARAALLAFHGDSGARTLVAGLRAPQRSFAAGLSAGRYDGILEARTAGQLSLLFRYATGALPLEYFAQDFVLPGVEVGATPRLAAEELGAVLTEAIDQLTRPIDAIKHQAKTVTVGISRAEEEPAEAGLLQATLAAGASRGSITYEDARALRALDLAVLEVAGSTRYAIDAPAGLDPRVRPAPTRTIRVLSQQGSSVGLRSRVEDDPTLKGTKNTVATERRVLVAVGRRDGRMVILVPENVGGECRGIVLLHVRLRESIAAEQLGAVLSGYRDRLRLLADTLAEAGRELGPDELAVLAAEPPVRLLTAPIEMLADRLTAGA